jgi:hypothetical protein
MSAEFVDQDDYFDDDSDVPSYWDPSEERDELDEPIIEDLESEPKHVELEFADDEESSISTSACITEDWQEVQLDGDVTVTDDCVDSELMRTMKIHSKHVLGTIDKEIQSFGKHELESLTPAVQLYHCFAESDLWSHLLDMINHRLPSEAHCEKREVELLVRFIFALAFYRISPSCVFDFPHNYPLAAVIVQEFVGDGPARIRQLLLALDPQKMSPDDEKAWHEPFSRNSDIEKAEKYVSQKCIRMVFRADRHSTLVIDDDKM